jgi:hypothetical protein
MSHMSEQHNAVQLMDERAVLCAGANILPIVNIITYMKCDYRWGFRLITGFIELSAWLHLTCHYYTHTLMSTAVKRETTVRREIPSNLRPALPNKIMWTNNNYLSRHFFSSHSADAYSVDHRRIKFKRKYGNYAVLCRCAQHPVAHRPSCSNPTIEIHHSIVTVILLWELDGKFRVQWNKTKLNCTAEFFCFRGPD